VLRCQTNEKKEKRMTDFVKEKPMPMDLKNRPSKKKSRNERMEERRQGGGGEEEMCSRGRAENKKKRMCRTKQQQQLVEGSAAKPCVNFLFTAAHIYSSDVGVPPLLPLCDRP
jgi:hypothetical protein